jgi:hypothetical protein
MQREPPPGSGTSEEIAALIYELLDAHDDTSRLAGAMTSGQDWDAHLDYLRALQRTGREVLARLALEHAANTTKGRAFRRKRRVGASSARRARAESGGT